MTATVIEQAGAIAERNQAEYLRTARRVAHREEITPDEIERCCTAAGKGMNEFENLVRSLEHRRRLREQAASLAMVEQEFMSLRATVDEETRKKDAAIAEFHRVTNPLAERMLTMRNDLAKLHTIPSQLIQQCPDHGLKALAKEIQRDEQDVGYAIRKANDRVEEMTIRMREIPHADRARFEAAIDRAKNEVEQLRERAAVLAARREEVTKEMLEF